MPELEDDLDDTLELNLPEKSKWETDEEDQIEPQSKPIDVDRESDKSDKEKRKKKKKKRDYENSDDEQNIRKKKKKEKKSKKHKDHSEDLDTELKKVLLQKLKNSESLTPEMAALASKLVNDGKPMKQEITVTVGSPGRKIVRPQSRSRSPSPKRKVIRPKSRSRSPQVAKKKSVKDRLGPKSETDRSSEEPNFKSSHWSRTDKMRPGKEQRNGKSSPRDSKSM